MRTVKEVSKLTGVSVRTLHYYDAIGLLEPTKVTDADYRMYDDTALSRLQNILLFRELQFPLKEIKEILDSPNFNQEEAVAQQIKLLELQYKHIGELISFAREIQTKGVKIMNFEVFDTKENENFYTCSNDILKELGEMYVCDDRFKKNIDCFGGEGTAEFVRDAISIYCDE